MTQFSHNESTSDRQKDLCVTTGTFIPSDYNKIITTPSGRPDSTAINLLAEIVYLHQPSKFGGNKKFSGDLLNLRYSDLEKKFNKSHESIRRAFVKLELLGLIKRSYQKISFKTTTCSNMLFIEFNKERYHSLLYKEEYLAPKNIIEAKNFCGHLKNEDSYPQKCGDVYREKEERNKEANSYGLSLFSFGFKVGDWVYPIQTNSSNSSWNILNISTSSNLEDDSRINKSPLQTQQPLILPEKTEEIPNKVKNLQENIQPENSNEAVISDSSTYSTYSASSAAPTFHVFSRLKSFEDYKWRCPTEFIPLDTEFCDLVRSRTGKNFPDSYFENVVIKLFAEDRKQYGDKLKWRRVQLLSRLVAWASRELKDLDSILAECGIKSSEELRTAKAVEKMEAVLVARCENSKDISPIGSLKRKIAGSMEQKMAAFLLQNASFEICSFTEKVTTKILSYNQETEEFVDPESSKSQVLENTLTDIAKSLLGQGACSSIIRDFERNGMSGGLYGSLGSTSCKNQVTYSESKLYRNVQESLYKKFGDGVYKSWFSKLEFYRVRVLDSVTKSFAEDISMMLEGMQFQESRSGASSKHQRIYGESIYVTAPTKFMSDWVKNNYATAIEESFKEIGVELFDVKSLTTEEFKTKLLEPTANYEGSDGLEIIDSSVVMQNMNQQADGSDRNKDEKKRGDRYYHEHQMDPQAISIAS